MNDEQTQPPKTVGFDKQLVAAAVTYADRAISRDAMRLHNPHDLNNIRQQIHSAAMLVNGGEPRFHQIMALMCKNPKTDPLVYNAYAMIAERLGIKMTAEERRAVAESNTIVKGAKLLMPRQPADLDIDMRALKMQVTPQHTRLDDEAFSLATKHNGDDYYEKLIAEGYSEDAADHLAAQFPLTLSRIGQSLGRYNPNYNNSVEFLDMVTERVLAYNKRKNPHNPSHELDEYVRGWRDEVKYDFMGVDPEKINAVKATIHDVAQEMLTPQQRPSRHKKQPVGNDPALGDASVSRYFRDLAEGTEHRKAIPTKSYHNIARLLQDLSDNYSERHDPAKVTLYLQAFMQSEPYKKIQSSTDIETCRILDLAIGEICNRLHVPFPPELESKEYLMTKFREDQRRAPDADMYWRRLAADIQQSAASKSGGIS